MSANKVFAFPTELGWTALVGSRRVLLQLTFGHATPQVALAALAAELTADAEYANWHPTLVRRIERYAAGSYDDFSDVEVEGGPLTAFQRRVVAGCRRIPFGETMTYGQLAAAAGSPGAARAVGNVMATNRTPLVVPCHRVVASAGGLGGYSAAGGIRTKLRMLELESHSSPSPSTRKSRPRSRKFATLG